MTRAKHDYVRVAQIAAILASGGAERNEVFVRAALSILNLAAAQCDLVDTEVEALKDEAVGNREDADYWRGLYEDQNTLVTALKTRIAVLESDNRDMEVRFEDLEKRQAEHEFGVAAEDGGI